MTRTRRSTILAASLCLLLAGSAAARTDDAETAPSLESMLPEDATLVMMVHDLPGLREKWAESPLAALWAEPAVQELLAPMLEDIDMDEINEEVRAETGYTLDEIVDMAEGDLVMYFPGLAEEFLAMEETTATEGEEPDDPPVVFAAWVGDNAATFEEMLLESERLEDESDDAESVERETRDYRDVTLRVALDVSGDEVATEEAWAIADGVFILATQVDLLSDAVDAVLDGRPARPMRADSAWQRARQMGGRADASLFVDLERLMPLVQEGIKEAAAADEQTPFTPEALSRALALESFEAMFISASLDGPTTRVDAGLFAATDRGLMKVLAYGPGTAPRSGLIPAEASSFSSARFDFQAAWAGVTDILNTLNPALLAMGKGQLDGLLAARELELDLRADLLENLGAEMITVEVPGEASGPGEVGLPGTVFGIAIKDRVGVERVLETLKNLAGQGSELFSDRDYLGTTIYSLAPEAAGGETETIAYAVTDGWLLLGFGSEHALEEVLVTASRPAASIWDRDEVRTALAALPGGAVAIGYQDLPAQLTTVLTNLAPLWNSDDGDAPIDVTSIPDEDVFARHLGPAVGAVYRSADALSYRAMILPAEER